MTGGGLGGGARGAAKAKGLGSGIALGSGACGSGDPSRTIAGLVSERSASAGLVSPSPSMDTHCARARLQLAADRD